MSATTSQNAVNTSSQTASARTAPVPILQVPTRIHFQHMLTLPRLSPAMGIAAQSASPSKPPAPAVEGSPRADTIKRPTKFWD